jgi:glycerol-3-phosphate dehydrogenase (NAD(P)+)
MIWVLVELISMAVEGPHRIAVLGAGSWGTALAVHLAASGRHVTLWARDPSLAAEIAARRSNPRYLPAIDLPPTVRPTASMAEAVSGVRLVILAVPSHGLRAVVGAAAPALPAGVVLVSAAKGLETETLQRMSEVVAEETAGRHPIVVLSGPSFASEVVRRLPTALVVASVDEPACQFVQQELKSASLRLYGSDDVAGVEIGAALKNIIAIAAGVVEALQLGHNALAALVTRGLAEMSRLSSAMGGRRETLAGLSGLGDLVLTCTGELSRNRRVGIELGRGRPLDVILGDMHMVAEGVRTTSAALALGRRHGVELPIAAQMAEVLAGRQTPLQAVGCLMLRPQRGESDGSA